MTTRFEAAEKKLREAQFFAGKIDAARMTREPECTEAIDFYLSAFLSAARSIYHVLKSQAPTVFPQWCNEWLACQSQDVRNTFNAIRTGRDHSLKEGTQPTRENRLLSGSTYPPELQLLFEDDLPVTPREFLGRLSPNDFEQDLVARCRECIAVLTNMIISFAETGSMNFTGKYCPRSSAGQQPGGPPGETEVLSLNPGRRTRILDATGWETLEPGSMNLAVSIRDFEALLSARPIITEPGKDIRYPRPFESIPITRVEYYYYKATATHAGKSWPVLVRRPKVSSPCAKVVELFAEVNLVDKLMLNPGALVHISLVVCS